MIRGYQAREDVVDADLLFADLPVVLCLEVQEAVVVVGQQLVLVFHIEQHLPVLEAELEHVFDVSEQLESFLDVFHHEQDLELADLQAESDGLVEIWVRAGD